MRRSQAAAAAALIAILIMAFTAAPALAAEASKVGHVDLQKVLNDSKEGQRAREDLETMVRSRQALIDEKIGQKDRIMEEYERQGLMMSEDVKREKEEKVARLDKEIKRMISDSNDEVQKAQRDRERDILRAIEGIIGEVAEKNGFALVVPSDVVIYSIEAVDLTPMVLEAFDRKAVAGPRK